MKKRKLTIWLNVATLCLCLATLAFGVYSAKTARLTTNGTVSFKAHECKVAVVGTISNAMRSESLNYAVVSDKTYTNQGASSDQTWQDKFDKGTEEDGTTLKTISETDTWTFGDIYFDDMNIGNEEVMQSIIITLQISNYSAFPVKASFTMPSLDANLSTEGSVNEVYVDKMTESTPTTDSLVLKLTVTDKAQDINLQNLNLDVNFEKTTMPDAPLASDYYCAGYGGLNGNTLEISRRIMGPYGIKGLSCDENNEIVIPSIVKDANGKLVNIEEVNLGMCEQLSFVNKITFSEGIKRISVVNSSASTAVNGFPIVATVVLPSTLTEYDFTNNYNPSWKPNFYEIYNLSTSLELVKGSGYATNAIAVHTSMDEESIFTTTADGVKYAVDTDHSKSIIFSINYTGDVNLPAKLGGYDYEFISGVSINVSGSIIVDEGCANYKNDESGNVVTKDGTTTIWRKPTN